MTVVESIFITLGVVINESGISQKLLGFQILHLITDFDWAKLPIVKKSANRIMLIVFIVVIFILIIVANV